MRRAAYLPRETADTAAADDVSLFVDKPQIVHRTWGNVSGLGQFWSLCGFSSGEFGHRRLRPITKILRVQLVLSTAAQSDVLTTTID